MEEPERTDIVSESARTAARRDRHAYLLGTPPLREFMEFIRARCPGSGSMLDENLTEEWRGAARRIRELEDTERGCVDNAALLPLPDAIETLASEVLLDPVVARSLRLLPYRWAMVELDRLIVHQRSVDLAFISDLKRAVPSRPNHEDLLRIASGGIGSAPEVQVTRTSENVYTFSSVSSDLRFLDLALLHPNAVRGYDIPGRATKVLALFVGYGVNLLCALRMQGRLILINGTHRAHLLCELGVRRLPCLVREVACDEDLDLIGASEIKQSLPVYLRAPRPPLLKDFFDPLICKIIPVASASRLVHVQVNTQRSRLTIA
jgi:hypothetical protein